MSHNIGIDYLKNIPKFIGGLNLKRISYLLELIGNPQDKLKFIHIAGTNGKGSTCSMTASILIQAGYKVGKFISPHLEEINERISVNNLSISNKDIERLTGIVREKTEHMIKLGMEHPTQFEVICTVGLQYFYEQGCDIVVLETGLGGRFDATNIIKVPLVSVITSISYDHVERLGSTLEEIAREKAGIIKDSHPVVCYPQVKEVAEVIRDTCIKKGCSLIEVQEKNIKNYIPENGYEIFDFERYKTLKIKLLGRHQLINACVAIKTIEELNLQGFKILKSDIYEGLKNAQNKGRFEILGCRPEFIIDGAHNLSGIKALEETLYRFYSGKRIILVMAVLSTKDYHGMAGIISSLAEVCIAAEPDNLKALPAKELEAELSKSCKNVLIEAKACKAVDTAIRLAGEDGVVCCCGSLYFIGEVRRYYNAILNKG